LDDNVVDDDDDDDDDVMMMITITAEIQRLRKEMESSSERSDRQMESLQQKLATADKDYKATLQQAKHAHEEDVTRLTEIQASRSQLLTVQSQRRNGTKLKIEW